MSRIFNDDVARVSVRYIQEKNLERTFERDYENATTNRTEFKYTDNDISEKEMAQAIKYDTLAQSAVRSIRESFYKEDEIDSKGVVYLDTYINKELPEFVVNCLIARLYDAGFLCDKDSDNIISEFDYYSVINGDDNYILKLVDTDFVKRNEALNQAIIKKAESIERKYSDYKMYTADTEMNFIDNKQSSFARMIAGYLVVNKNIYWSKLRKLVNKTIIKLKKDKNPPDKVVKLHKDK